MGVADDIRRRMRSVQTKGADAGQNIHEQAALEQAVAERQARDADQQRVSKEKSMVKTAQKDAKAQSTSAITGAAVDVGTKAIAAGASVADSKGLEKGKAAQEAGQPLTKRQQRLVNRDNKRQARLVAKQEKRTARRAARAEKRGGGPKVKGGLFAPLFSGGKVSASGELTEKGLQARSDAAGVDTNRPGTYAVDKNWGSEKPPPVTVEKNPLYNVDRGSPPSQNQLDKQQKQSAKATALRQSDSASERTKPSTPNNEFDGVFQSVSPTDTNAVVRIAKMPAAERKKRIAAMTPEQQEFYFKTLRDAQQRGVRVGGALESDALAILDEEEDR